MSVIKGRAAFIAILFFAALPAGAGWATDPPPGTAPIGGRWYLRAGERDVYLYRDGEEFVDLFSYHVRDSNRDGIDNVRLGHDDRFLILRSQGYPNHPTALFPNSGNPNTIRVQNFLFRLPLAPKVAGKITRVPMGPIGVALNGVVFFNPFEAGGMNAVEGYSEVWLDSCCGHPQQEGVYHYHKYPSCLKSPFPDDGLRHSPVIGFAFDGFPVHGPYEEAGVMARDLTGRVALDVCSGHSDKLRGYHYHVTPGRFPYTFGGYAGAPEPSNNHQLNHAGGGAIKNNASGKSRIENVIAAIRPGTAARGGLRTLTVELAPHEFRRGKLPAEKPEWFQIGPFEAKSMQRNGNLLTVEIDIPADAPLGVMLDCHLEFAATAGGERLVFKKNDSFRVIE